MVMITFLMILINFWWLILLIAVLGVGLYLYFGVYSPQIQLEQEMAQMKAKAIEEVKRKHAK